MRRKRPVGRIDVAASIAARLAPRTLRPSIDQLRLDAWSLLGGPQGLRESSFSTRAHPPLAPTPLLDIDPVHELLPRALRAPYATLRRDVGMVSRELRGVRVAPTITRRVAPHAAAVVAPPRRVRVVRTKRETEDAISIELAPIDGAPLHFEPGQFLTLRVVIEGALVSRAYSLSSTPGEAATITCKRIDGGRVSTHLHERLREGDVFETLGPSGSFVVRPRVPATARHVVLVAGGSGITPCWSIARAVLAREPATRITLLYGNRAERDVIFKDAIDALARADAERFRVVHVLSAPEAPREGPCGQLDGAMFDSLATELERDVPEYFLCGPAAMMDAVRDALLARRVPRARILEERFRSPAERRSDVTLPQLVTVRRRGKEHTFTTLPHQTMLEAATASGVALPFSCAIGGCAACRCKLVSGDVQMDEPSCLSDEERAAGWVLTCVGRPTAPTTLEVP